jgi:hypothetical protein
VRIVRSIPTYDIGVGLLYGLLFLHCTGVLFQVCPGAWIGCNGNAIERRSNGFDCAFLKVRHRRVSALRVRHFPEVDVPFPQ